MHSSSTSSLNQTSALPTSSKHPHPARAGAASPRQGWRARTADRRQQPPSRIAEQARCADGTTLRDLMPAAPDSPHGRTVDQMFADEPNTMATADDDLADRASDIERI